MSSNSNSGSGNSELRPMASLELGGRTLGQFTPGGLQYWPTANGIGFDVSGFQPAEGVELPAGELEFDLGHGLVVAPDQLKLIDLLEVLK